MRRVPARSNTHTHIHTHTFVNNGYIGCEGGPSETTRLTLGLCEDVKLARTTPLRDSEYSSTRSTEYGVLLGMPYHIDYSEYSVYSKYSRKVRLNRI
jgi:hypothetical protein